MLDFIKISTRSIKRGVVEIYPKFIIKKSSDLMIRGGDFYAIWNEEKGLWSTNEEDAVYLIDKELEQYAKENRDKIDAQVNVLYMWDAESGTIDKWHKYCQNQMWDNFEPLDRQLIFSNYETTKKDYASIRLNYPLEPGETVAYDKLMSTLYSEEERHKIEWAIGAVVIGDSKRIHKFLVLYGAPGTGKSTVFNIMQKLFNGYWKSFDARALGSSSNSFALEAFKTNPLVGIQHDGDLSRLEDNTRLNSLVSHETMTVNEKFKSAYDNSFDTFLFMGTNSPVKITNAKSGLIRRLIDVSPSGNLLSPGEYKRIVKQINFELGAIAFKCREIYLQDPGYYDDYIPTSMLGASNDFYNFIMDSYFVFSKENGTTLKAAWEMYKVYCEDAKVPYPFSQRVFKEELKNYFSEYKERYTLEDGTRVRSYYLGFSVDKFDNQTDKPKPEPPKPKLIEFDCTESIFDKECSDCPAQYATKKETPSKKWSEVKTTLSALDTTRLHYVKVPENHIVIDFDIPDKNGNKCFEANLKEASQWPPTYAELSKSGAGIHLHYIYSGDVSKLSRVYDDHIEVKIFTGNSSLRRKLTKCNNLPVATISSGLPLKGDDRMINDNVVKNEKGIRTLIKMNLAKEIHPGTKPSIDFIHKILEDAYESGAVYDVTDMRNAVLTFAAGSTNQADYCIKLVNKMKFKSAEDAQGAKNDDAEKIFYDVEVFPNLFLVNWKMEGKGKQVVRMINPSPAEIEELMRYRLIGFNCRRYDNHILYARLMGYTNEQLFRLSQRIIDGDKGAFFGEAYNVSYTDVFDFASAANKKSLKKWEIELGIHHQELGLPWDQPVPEELWEKVAEYCDNDVIATEAVFNHLKPDWTARQILADLAGMTVNDTTNSLTTRIIFGKNRKPQEQFNYRDMGKISRNAQYFTFDGEPDEDLGGFILSDASYSDIMGEDDLAPQVYEVFDIAGKPYFPGYKYEFGKSTYRGEEVGEGGYVYAEQGMYTNVALLDVASMHPHSIIAENLFGDEFTRRFKEIVDGRVTIKHEDWEVVNTLLDGKLEKYVQKVINGEMSSKDLANALKTAINSVYGLTSANFDNPFRDVRNKDNIVAKRGALFMINLKHAVQERGYIVAHIKTDSIKIPDADPEIIEFVMEYGKMYGYTFEHEATYDRMCLVNDAVYIAKDKANGEWTATGTQFAVPYVFKKLFTKEDITFEDMCETKSVAKGDLYLDMNESLPDVSEYETVLELRNKRGAKLTKKQADLLDKYSTLTDEELKAKIDDGHNYIFVGRVGQFCPMKDDTGGGALYRYNDDKYYAATGTKGFKWMETETVRALGKQDDIDRTYYDNLVNEAADTISSYGDLEWFISDDSEVIHHPGILELHNA